MAVRDHNVEFKSNLWIGVLFLSHACVWLLILLACFQDLNYRSARVLDYSNKFCWPVD